MSTAIHMLLALATVACGGADAPRADSSAHASTPASPAFRVALLTPGPISDQSWNGGAYAGLLRIRDSLGATISHIQTHTPAEFEEQFRQYGAQGYDLVIGHGFEFQDAATRVAPDFPRTTYVITSGTVSGPNLAGIAFAFTDASYLAGIVAGKMTKSNVIGTIGGTELPPVKESFAAFARGARSVNPKVTIVGAFIGNWDDVSAGKEQALAQIGRGADVIFQNADAAGLGVFQAARETKKALIIGSNANQNAIAPEITIGSVVIDLPRALTIVAKEVRGGHFVPRVISLGSTTDVVTLVVNPAFANQIPAPLRRTVDSLRAEMRAGQFDAARH